MVAALNRFISKSSDKCYAFFHALKGKSRRNFEWTMDCDSALTELKEYLSSVPILLKPKEYETLYLYLAVSAHAVSSALVRRVGTDDLPIYFTSKTLLLVQTRYLPLEKLALALVSAARKLFPYFQSYTITILTEHPLKSLFRKADLSNRVSKWAVELANFDICFEPRTAIKGQILADFIVELTLEDTKTLNTPAPQPITKLTKVLMPWKLFQGDSCSLSIDFPAINNEAEYEALLAGLLSAVAMKINHEDNAHADALAGLALASTASKFRTINFGSIDHPSFDTTPKVLNVELAPSWMDKIIAFLKHDTLPVDKMEAYCIKNKVAYYWFSESGQLYRKSFSGPYLLVVHPTQLPTAPGGFKFLITATDYFSKWVEAEPLPTITEADVRRFVWRNIVTRFGVPYAIVSDNRSQFVSKDLTSLCVEFSIRFFNSTSAYPQGNGQAEATNKTVCAGIKRRLHSKRGKWVEELPHVLWAYHSTPRRSTGQTPFSMAFGMEAVIPLKSRFPILRIENFDPKTNDEAVEQELILA
ncbi:uncharacterized protein LOC131306759 [Rhododendron vialii]|uniref:uncharacterized protein LOC131306759 n=1 Tax=Rhododendron vialii TaxID=182163 RepID=UPI00265E0095|nr:uncharacterized protein LOC131306759 [Rhododendron vialii]